MSSWAYKTSLRTGKVLLLVALKVTVHVSCLYIYIYMHYSNICSLPLLCLSCCILAFHTWWLPVTPLYVGVSVNMHSMNPSLPPPTSYLPAPFPFVVPVWHAWFLNHVWYTIIHLIWKNSDWSVDAITSLNLWPTFMQVTLFTPG